MNNYFDLIDQDYIREVSLASKDLGIQEAFKLAYLILFFHNVKEDKDGKNLLLGDLFISLLSQRLLCQDKNLLKKIMNRVALCHSKKIHQGGIHYKEELLSLLKDVT